MVAYNEALALGLAEHANLAYFHKAALKRLVGDEDFAFVEGQGERVDTQAFVVTVPEGVIVAFRGTQQPEDVLTDVWEARPVLHDDGSSRRVHHGFWHAYEVVREQILAEIKVREPKHVFVTGHSLGGALATLAALDIAQAETPPKVTMYNFGSPRVGDWLFAEEYNDVVKDSHRVVAGRDAVPCLAAAGWWPFGYRHVDREYRLGSVALPFLDHDLVQSYMPQLSRESGGQSFFDQED